MNKNKGSPPHTIVPIGVIRTTVGLLEISEFGLLPSPHLVSLLPVLLLTPKYILV